MFLVEGLVIGLQDIVVLVRCHHQIYLRSFGCRNVNASCSGFS